MRHGRWLSASYALQNLSWLRQGGTVVARWQGQITADEVDRVVNDLERENLAS